MIGFVSYILAVFVCGKRHAKLNQVKKSVCGCGSFTQSKLSVNRLALMKRRRHFPNAVSVRAGKRELVVRLLVTACVSAGSAAHSFRHNGNIRMTKLMQAFSSAQTGCAGAYDNGMHLMTYGSFSDFHVRLPFVHSA